MNKKLMLVCIYTVSQLTMIFVRRDGWMIHRVHCAMSVEKGCELNRVLIVSARAKGECLETLNEEEGAEWRLACADITKALDSAPNGKAHVHPERPSRSEHIVELQAMVAVTWFSHEGELG